MSFGTWKERRSENRDEEPETFTGVLIKGLASNVKKATEQVKEIERSAPGKFK
jgi:hypothetical protein